MSQFNKLIIIATYNEKENITLLLNKIFDDNVDVDVLIVDDNSPDKTAEIIMQLQIEKFKDKLFLITRSGKLGLGTAYIEGFKWALQNNYKFILHMDADFSHNPKYIKHFFSQIIDNDLVIGSRYMEGGNVKNWSFIRKMISKGGSLYSRTILNLPIKDLTGGYKCFRSDTLKKLDFDNFISTGFSFQIEINYRVYLNKLKIKEIPIIFENRKYGKSKMSLFIFIEGLFNVLKLKFKLRNYKS